MSASAPLPTETFAGNRAVGRVAFTVAADAGRSRRGRVHEAGALRVRFPNGDGQTLEAVMVNTAGGMTGGDRFDIDVKVGAGREADTDHGGGGENLPLARPGYRDRGEARCRPGRHAGVAAAGNHCVRSGPAAALDRRRSRSAARNCCWPKPSFSAGPPWAKRSLQGRFIDRWRVRVGGALVFAETVRLDGMIAQSTGAAAPSRQAASPSPAC